MAQNRFKSPHQGYPQAQVDPYSDPREAAYSPSATGYAPQPAVQSGHPALQRQPNEDRLFAEAPVRSEPQYAPHPSVAATADPLGHHGNSGLDSRAYDPDPRAGFAEQPQAAYVYDTNGFAPDPAQARPLLGPAQWGGALVSLALILGLGIWGYKLMVRDVAGVPVIRALEGSARILPDDPGGQLAMHQGLAVNSVTADGSAAAPADQYILAPSATELTAEDQPMNAVETVLTSYAPSTSAFDVQPEANLEQVSVQVDPLELTEVAQVAATGVLRSPVPMPRPKTTANAGGSAAQLAALSSHDGASLNGVAGDIMAALVSQGEMSTTDVPTGSRLVQFGAFQSEEIARQEWDRLTGTFENLMDGKTRVIEKAESGGKTFYRLRAYGFADASDANRFCSALTSMNAACTPTVQR